MMVRRRVRDPGQVTGVARQFVLGTSKHARSEVWFRRFTGARGTSPSPLPAVCRGNAQTAQALKPGFSGPGRPPLPADFALGVATFVGKARAP